MVDNVQADIGYQLSNLRSNRQQIENELSNLTESERLANEIAGRRIPQRKFRSNVTRQQQQQVVQQRAQAQEVIPQIQQERQRIQESQSEIQAREDELNRELDFERGRKLARKTSNPLVASGTSRAFREGFREERQRERAKEYNFEVNKRLKEAQKNLIEENKKYINIPKEFLNKSITGLEKRGTTTNVPSFNQQVFTQPTLYQEQRATFTDPQTGKTVPIYDIKYADINVRREATKQEQEYFLAKINDKEIASSSRPNLILRSFGELKGIAQQKLYYANQGGKELLTNFGINEERIQKINRGLTEYLSPYGTPKLAKEFISSFISKIQIETYQKPFTSLATLGLGFGLGATIEGVGIVGTRFAYGLGVSKAGVKLGSYAFDAFGLGLAGAQGLNVANQLSQPNLRVKDYAEILAVESTNTALFIGGATLGSKSIEYLFQPRILDLEFAKPSITLKEKSLTNLNIPDQPTRLTYVSSEEGDFLAQKFIQKGYKFVVSEGKSTVLLSRFNEEVSNFLGLIPKTDFIGLPKGGKVQFTDIFGKNYDLSISRKEYLKSYEKANYLLSARGFNEYQISNVLRSESPKKIFIKLDATAINFQNDKDIVSITGKQISKPIKVETFGFLESSSFKISTKVKTGGRSQELDLSAYLQKLSGKKAGFSSAGEKFDDRIIYKGLKIVSGKQLKYGRIFSEEYRISPIYKVRKGLEEESAIFSQIELVKQVSISQPLKPLKSDITFKLESNLGVLKSQKKFSYKIKDLVKPESKIFTDITKTYVKTEQPFSEVISLRELPKQNLFDTKTNDYLRILKLDKFGQSDSELKLFKLISGKEYKAQSLPFSQDFYESYELLGQRNVMLKDFAPKIPKPIILKFKEPKTIYSINEEGEIGFVKTKRYNLKSESKIESFSYLKGEKLTKKEIKLKQLDSILKEKYEKYSYKPSSSLTAKEELINRQLQLRENYVPAISIYTRPKSLSKVLYEQKTNIKLVQKSNLKINTEIKLNVKIQQKLEPKISLKLEPIAKLEPRLNIKVEPRLNIKPQLNLKLEPEITPSITIKLPPITNFNIKDLAPQISFERRKKKKPGRTRFSEQLVYLPDLTARALNLKTNISLKNLIKLSSKSVSGLDIRRIATIKI